MDFHHAAPEPESLNLCLGRGGGRARERARPLSPAVAEGTLAGQHDVALVGALGAGAFAAAVDRGAEEVGPRVDTRGVDVVVLGEVAHGWRGGGGRDGLTAATGPRSYLIQECRREGMMMVDVWCDARME